MKKAISSFMLCVLLGVCAGFFCGCETAENTEALTVSPAEANLSTGSTTNDAVNTVTFTATDGLRDLSLPLEWRVTNPSIGRIVGAAGLSASYQATVRTTDGSLVNTVIVKDQYDAEGLVTVRQ